jgi:predicted GNAT family acetyltransferase
VYRRRASRPRPGDAPDAAVAYGIRERGETPFLHVASSNTEAISLYEAMGYAGRRSFEVVALRPPAL